MRFAILDIHSARVRTVVEAATADAATAVHLADYGLEASTYRPFDFDEHSEPEIAVVELRDGDGLDFGRLYARPEAGLYELRRPDFDTACADLLDSPNVVLPRVGVVEHGVYRLTCRLETIEGEECRLVDVRTGPGFLVLCLMSEGRTLHRCVREEISWQPDRLWDDEVAA